MKILCNISNSDEFDIDNTGKLIKGYSDAKEIHVPDGVTSIGRQALYNCKNAEIIYLPDSVVSLDEGAFTAQKVQKIVLSPNITILPYGAIDFASITEIDIPYGVGIIGKQVFSGCTDLVKVSIPSSVKVIGEGAFSGCKSIETLYIPDGVTEIGKSAFSSEINLKSVRLPRTLKVLSSHLFSDCIRLKHVEMPDNSITRVKQFAFHNCESLTELSFPNSLKSVEGCAFRNCTALKHVSFPPDVVFNFYPPAPPFSGCPNVELPSHLEYLKHPVNESTTKRKPTRKSRVPSKRYKTFEGWYKSSNHEEDNRKFLEILESLVYDSPDYEVVEFVDDPSTQGLAGSDIITIELADGDRYEFEFDWEDQQRAIYEHGASVAADMYYAQIDMGIQDETNLM